MDWITNRKPTKEDSPILAYGESIWDYFNIAALHWLTEEDGWNGPGWYDHSDEYGMKEEEIKVWMPLPKPPKAT